MFRQLTLKRMSDEEFVRLIVKEARENYKKSIEEKWPEMVPTLGIPYSKYEWERIIKNLRLLKQFAYQANLRVEIMEDYKEERYLRFSYIFYETFGDG